MSKAINNKATGSKLKTNMQMTVKINDDFSIHVSHKDGMCNLNEIFQYGNERRDKLGESNLNMDNWLRRYDVCKFIQAHEKLTYSNFVTVNRTVANSSQGSITCDTLNCMKAVRGHGTRADLLLTIRAAAALDPELEVLIYHIFISQGILNLRDKGGNNFKKLNKAIGDYLPGREGKASNQGIYINAAKKIRKGLGFESIADWNVQEADAKVHEQRADVEKALVLFLKNGFVAGKDHLWDLIDKQCKMALSDD